MHTIKVYTELHWVQERPKLRFWVNQTAVPAQEHTVETTEDVERVIFSLVFGREFDAANTLDIELYDKKDLLKPEESQCFVDIKNISVDDILADYLMYNTEFRHRMPDNWVRGQAARGYQAVPSYSPGTMMHLNGACTWRFDAPVWLGKVSALWNQ
jgi:hypothetical protein